jgi:quercetin dioxygenase-like cupin family protein
VHWDLELGIWDLTKFALTSRATLPPVKSRLRGGSAALLLAGLWSASAGSLAQAPAASPHHKVVGADAIQWKQLRPGAEIAVISGDPNKEGSPFVMRFRYSGKARIPPHWHPTDEHLTILTGTFRLGVGERGDESATTALGPGGYAFVAAKMAHYAWAEDGTTVQAHGIGPFVINYVNPADDPNKAGKK